jgi:hypothetical protein
MTIDWASQYSGKHITDLQIMTPYLHYNNGEGFTCVPEVGAIAMVCFPSDEESPFVMGFVSAPEMEGAEVGDLENEIKEPGVESEEDLPTGTTTQSGGSTSVDPGSSDVGFRAGRPVMNPGDMLWQGRDENWVALRRGGVLQLGSTNICQRAYIPVGNFIRDFCENWEVNTASGSISWTVAPSETDPSGDAPTELVLIAREHAQDKKASVKISIGSLDDAEKPPGGDKTFMEVVIAPEGIDPSNGDIVGTKSYVMRLDKSGNEFKMYAGSRTVRIAVDDTLEVGGDLTLKVGKNANTEITGNASTTIGGAHTLKGASSSETWAISKVISAASLKLGSSAASEPVVLGLKLITWLTNHVHMVPAVPAPDPNSVIPTLPVSGHPSTQSFVTMAQSLLSKSVTVNQ